jgi:alpha-tubulin suppressor-like RCC1 family protein
MRYATWLLAAHLVFAFHAAPSAHAGLVYAWGYNGDGELGDGTTTNRNVPVPVNGLGDVVSVAAGGPHSMALLSDGTVSEWGFGATTPVAVNGLTNVTAISAGAFHSLALRSDGTMSAWGYNGSGQLGDGTTTSRPTPVAVALVGANVASISAGGYDSLALFNGTVAAWGDNFYGQLGSTNGSLFSDAPRVIGNLPNVTAIAAGAYHALALVSDGTVRAWGWNGYGQLGDGSTGLAPTVEVSGLSGVKAIAAGYGHSLALLSDGTVRAWGDNDNGQLGDGTTVRRYTPVAVPGLSNIVEVEAGYLSSYVISADGSTMEPANLVLEISPIGFSLPKCPRLPVIGSRRFPVTGLARFKRP